jgi:hypothetical protein
MSILVALLVVIGVIAVVAYFASRATERPPDPDDQPDVSPDHDVLGGQPPRAPGGHPVPGTGPDGRP